MRVGYVLDRFPSVHQMFVLNEMLALEALGIELVVLSLLDGAKVVHEEVDLLRAPVVHAPQLGDVSLNGRAHARGLATPDRWARATKLLASGGGRVAAVGWFRGVSLAPVARSLGITHFHAHFATGANVAAHTLAALLRVPFSFSMHAVDLYARPVLLPETLRAAKFGVTSTEYNLRYIEATYGEELAAKVALVRACVDPDRFASVVPEPHPVPTVVTVGRLVEKKGHLDLIHAFALLKEKAVPFRGLIVGDGPERDAIEQAIASADLGDDVSLLGAITQDEVRRALAVSDLVVLPSIVARDGDQDGIPVVLIEALAVGLPVVSTTVSGIPELVSEDVGILVPPEAPEALAAAMAELLGDPARRARLGAAGPGLIRDRFDVAESAAQMAVLFGA